MNRNMRLDPVSTHSDNPRGHGNGSLPPLQKNGVSASTNGHSSPTNGTASHQNGFSSLAENHSPTYYGHDREEVTRLLIQGLNDLGYINSANRLVQESGFEVESPAVAAFRDSIIQGHWSEAESLLFGVDSEVDGGGVSISNGNWHHPGGFQFADGAEPDGMRFRIREQKYLELLERKETVKAMMVLRDELQPLRYNGSRLNRLSGFLCTSTEDLQQEAHWDGAHGNSRQDLLQELSRSISSSVMIPDHRLAVLFDQVKQRQISKCIYHNPLTPQSLFTDHLCDRSQFPLHNLVELDRSVGEIWCLQFSHDGKSLAACGEHTNVIIYNTNTFQVRRTLTEHDSGVVFVSWSPDDSRLITCSRDHKARLWDMNTGTCTASIDHHNECVSTAAWAPDGEAFVTGSLNLQSQLCLSSLDGRKLFDWEIDYRVQSCAITPDGKRLVTVSSDPRIIVYNFVTREEEYSFTAKAKMTCLNISRDSRYILINLEGEEIQLIDLETAEVVRRFLGYKQEGFVIRSCFGGVDENLIVSGSADGKVYIWHKENGTLIETLEGQVKEGCVSAVAWNPTNPGMFASAGDDSRVKIWSKQPEPPAARRRPSSSSSRSRRIRYEPAAILL